MTNNNLRKTGIEVVGDIPWGSHFCQFYKTKEDLLDILIPYFKAGLENNEMCVWVTSEFLTTDEAITVLRKTIHNFDSYLKKGQIEIFPHTEWYLKGGFFEMKRVLKNWVIKHDNALKKGYDGTRVSGNPFWLDNKKDWNDFAAYEAEINNVIDKYKLVVLCTYSLNKCGSNEIIDVVSNHEFALIKRNKKWESIETAANKKMSSALKYINEELQKIDQRKDEFISIASHELKTPLTTIKAFTQILEKRLEKCKDKNNSYFIKNINQHVDKLTNLINELLDVSKIQAGKLAFNKNEFSIDELVNDIVTNFRHITETHDIIKKGVIKTKIYADKNRIEQVLINLISNAIKYSPSSKKIIVSVSKKNNKIIVSVQDSGLGISKKDQEKIFKKFFRTNNEKIKNIQGFGLGLYISSQIIKRHNGDLWVKSKKGKGSKFIFSLPLK